MISISRYVIYRTGRMSTYLRKIEHEILLEPRSLGHMSFGNFYLQKKRVLSRSSKLRKNSFQQILSICLYHSFFASFRNFITSRIINLFFSTSMIFFSRKWDKMRFILRWVTAKCWLSSSLLTLTTIPSPCLLPFCTHSNRY